MIKLFIEMGFSKRVGQVNIGQKYKDESRQLHLPAYSALNCGGKLAVIGCEGESVVHSALVQTLWLQYPTCLYFVRMLYMNLVEHIIT